MLHLRPAFASIGVCRTTSAAHVSALPRMMAPVDLFSDLSHSIASLADSAMHLADASTAALASDISSSLDAVTPPMDGATDLVDGVDLTPKMEEASLDALGRDLLLFLAASVVVTPLGNFLGLSPVLLYLLFGFVAGPYGMGLFSGDTGVDAEIGDFGILFLLFVEGLNLSPERLKALGSFFSLGAAQLLLSVGGIFFGFFFGGPYLQDYILPFVQNLGVDIDTSIVSLLEKPVVAFSIAAAGALSSSAFVLPILKEKGWEDRPDGIAALSILLLQDLAVAPLLVILPLLVDYYDTSSGVGLSQDPVQLGLLVAKATVGFGGVLVVASFALRRIFQIVASYGSSQSFVSASLVVAVGMGIVADMLGLSSTTGAFAAGVLLAESGYRAQIEADIRPFEGILLGVFFVTAGASLDPMTVVQEWPTLLVGIAVFLGIKISVLFFAGEFALGLTRADSARVALLLAGGGEFAFVVFKLAENLGVLPENLSKLLTASVIISMSLTPLLGEVAEYVGTEFELLEARDVANARDDVEDYRVDLMDEQRIRDAFEVFDEDGSGAISVDELQKVLIRPGTSAEKLSGDEVRAIIDRFDDNGDGELQSDEFAALWIAKCRSEGRGKKSEDGGKLALTRAVVVCGYGEVGRGLCTALDGGPAYVAFDRDPACISTGVLNGAPVVYGDGASSSLVIAAGVEAPAAIAITYDSEDRCLEATLRLREAFPNSPIYVRASRQDRVGTLVKAGATEVVVESSKAAEGLSNLIDLSVAVTDPLAEISLQSLVAGSDRTRKELLASEDELTDLAKMYGKNPDEMQKLYELFATSLDRNEKGEVQLAELRNELMRMSDQPLDDRALADWMGYEEALSKWVTGNAEKQWVSFSDFLRFYKRRRDKGDSGDAKAQL